MAFSQNLQYLRTRQKMTQEQLAEYLNVSRQSVSKWESGASFPEMETLITLCDVFHTDMDTLLRGSAAQSLAEDSAGYDRFMNAFSLKIAGSVAAIIAGVALAALLSALGLPTPIATAALLLAVTAATVVLVASGMQHSNFVERHPVITDFYTQKQRDDFNQRFVWYIAAPVGAILCGVALVVLAFCFLPEREPYESAVGAVFLCIIAISVFFLIYGGMQKSKYDIAAYNNEYSPSPQVRLRNAVKGAIMLTATVVFLVWGLFVEDGWAASWIAFPIGGILCGLAETIMSALQQKNADQEDR